MARELSNIQLDKRFRNEPRYGGAVSKNLLPRLNGRAFIVNLENSVDREGNELPGTHWSALYDCRPRFVYWYDSFGRPPPKIVLRRVKETGKKLVINRSQEQGINSIECGHLSAYVLARLFAGDRWKEIITKELYPRAFGFNDRVALNAWRKSRFTTLTRADERRQR